MTLAVQGSTYGTHSTPGTNYAVNNTGGGVSTGNVSLVAVPIASPVTSAKNAATAPVSTTQSNPPASVIATAPAPTTPFVTSQTPIPGTGAGAASTNSNSSYFPLLIVAILAGAALIADREGWI